MLLYVTVRKIKARQGPASHPPSHETVRRTQSGARGMTRGTCGKFRDAKQKQVFGTRLCCKYICTTDWRTLHDPCGTTTNFPLLPAPGQPPPEPEPGAGGLHRPQAFGQPGFGRKPIGIPHLRTKLCSGAISLPPAVAAFGQRLSISNQAHLPRIRRRRLWRRRFSQIVKIRIKFSN